VKCAVVQQLSSPVCRRRWPPRRITLIVAAAAVYRFRIIGFRFSRDCRRRANIHIVYRTCRTRHGWRARKSVPFDLATPVIYVPGTRVIRWRHDARELCARVNPVLVWRALHTPDIGTPADTSVDRRCRYPCRTWTVSRDMPPARFKSIARLRRTPRK